MVTKITGSQQGFTLIEVLIALLIIAISLTAILKATGEDTENLIKLKKYIEAQTVAAYGANLIKLSENTKENSYETNAFSQNWYWRVTPVDSLCEQVEKLNLKIYKRAYSQDTLVQSTLYMAESLK